MRVLVLGSGVVGTTTAFYLMKAGHEVVVVDRQSAPAQETSFANGGQIAAAHADPWASPATPLKALKWLGKKDAPLLFHYLRFDPALWSWCLRFLRNCTSARCDLNTEKTLRVAMHSRNCLKELRKEIPLSYDHREEGILHFYRDQKEFDLAVEAAQTMRKYGLDRRVLTPSECVTTEPALSGINGQLVGGIYSQDDESGDAHKFTRELAKKCEEGGVQFKWGHQIERFEADKKNITGVVTDQGLLSADRYVVCMGSFSPKLMAPLNVKLPIYPARGYSVTLQLGNPAKGPTVSLTDDEFKLVFSRLGDRLRIAGTAELGGYSQEVNDFRANFIKKKALELFPESEPEQAGEFWAGLRPKTPDSVPILGPTPYDSVFLNTGHGTLGWTMACGSAQITADIISGKAPKVALDGLTFDRF